ncbi:PKD domain-containing protein [Mucilaginibacter terrenus]|uniref:PKD domain-containing protein n=1 Tax=Mucilaginibacter terrenus TaxID=2482727 RepID=A0A3E2NV28_9SPHI|nr:gliding motility-associated C-terminal domain-containing protein [Mucilaginibacter terrenus]RFZ84873.1 PKD domain-containing protein [Mucilaginibacter terrenus]
MKRIIFVLCLFYSGSLLAQKQGNIWYFGYGAGLNFNTSPPTALTDSKMSAFEGCSSIADAEGALLFYTDGITVYNRQDTMKNGNYLFGNPSSTQSGVIVPQPGSSSIYYVFTILQEGRSMYYSIVDMSKNSGLGEVIEKNKLLIEKSTEKITAVKHQNNQDIWVLTHEYQSNKFLCYLITKDGLQPSPVASSVGTYMADDYLGTIGYMKASPKGDKLAAAMDYSTNLVEIYDFDKVTGKITNPQTITGFQGFGPYGVEFSPNGQFLYIGEEGSNIYQVKMPASSGTIATKGVKIGTASRLGALQLASDGKIYVAEPGGQYLHSIEQPNLEGLNCNFKNSTIYLGGKSSSFGLPNFIQSYFAEVAFSSVGTCIGEVTNFKMNTSLENIQSMKWNFGDPSSPDNTSTTATPSHKYATVGTYPVTLEVLHDGETTKFTKDVVIAPLPQVDLGKDVTLFYGQTLQLDAGNPGSTYKWNNGTAQQTLLVTAPGTYSVDVTSSAGCSSSGSINIKYDQVIDVSLRTDTVICKDETITLDVKLPGATYLWSNGSTASSISLTQPGTYSVTITNAYQNRTKTLSIKVAEYQFAPVTVTSNTVLCEWGSTSITVKGAKAKEKYRWFDANKNFVEENSGTLFTGIIRRDTTLYAQLTNGKCESTLYPVTLTFDKPLATIYNKDTIVTLGDVVKLKGTGSKYFRWVPDTYLDNANIAAPTSTPDDDITYQLIVSNDNGCSDTSTVTILVKKQVVIPNTFTPNGDGINDVWNIKYVDRLLGNHLYIYNRNGSIIKDIKYYTGGWDGTNNSGKPLPAGVYYYVIQLDEKNKQSGYVTIIR